MKRLVWFEACGAAWEAFNQEKRIKRWRRDWKVDLIERSNPDWNDLWPELMGLNVDGPLAYLQGR